MHRIRLDNTAFEGRNAAYLFEGERTVLVDTGVAVPDVRTEIEAGLERCGVAVADLDEILVTHWHYDHAGLTGAFQDESDATVRAHRLDAPLVARDADAESDLDATRGELLDAWGMPPGPKTELRAFLADHGGVRGARTDVRPLSDGETVRAGDETLRAVHTPGHTAGHCCFVRTDAPAGRSVLAGDALLPEYTPNVGGADPRVDAALATYLDTLEWLAGAGFDRASPGHRDPIDDPVARAREIVDHHATRARRILAYLRDAGPADTWTVSAHLFGDLSGIHIVHGPGEAHAHLEHLADHDVLERQGTEYAVVGSDPDVASLFPDFVDPAATD